MSESLLVPGAPLFFLIFAATLFYAAIRVKRGNVPVLRRINAYEALKSFTGRTVEAGRILHLSLGLGSVANETTSDSLAGLYVLDHLARQAADTDMPPLVTMANPLVMLLAQNISRKAHLHDPEGAKAAYRHTWWIAPQPAAYAAGVMNILNQDDVEANVMVGSFGDEYLLMGETAAWRQVAHVGGTSNPNALPFIYASADETLLGEEIYAAGAYLERRPFHLGSLVAQDTMRWIIALLILASILITTLS